MNGDSSAYRALQEAGFDLHSAGPVTPKCRAERGAWTSDWFYGSPLNWSAVLEAVREAFPDRFNREDGSRAVPGGAP